MKTSNVITLRCIRVFIKACLECAANAIKKGLLEEVKCECIVYRVLGVPFA